MEEPQSLNCKDCNYLNAVAFKCPAIAVSATSAALLDLPGTQFYSEIESSILCQKSIFLRATPPSTQLTQEFLQVHEQSQISQILRELRLLLVLAPSSGDYQNFSWHFDHRTDTGDGVLQFCPDFCFYAGEQSSLVLGALREAIAKNKALRACSIPVHISVATSQADLKKKISKIL